MHFLCLFPLQELGTTFSSNKGQGEQGTYLALTLESGVAHTLATCLESLHHLTCRFSEKAMFIFFKGILKEALSLHPKNAHQKSSKWGKYQFRVTHPFKSLCIC